METSVAPLYVAGLSFNLKPAYEGWKHPVPSAFLNTRFNLKPAYEGWKPETNTTAETNTTESFKACLWGMETRMQFHIICPVDQI